MDDKEAIKEIKSMLLKIERMKKELLEPKEESKQTTFEDPILQKLQDASDPEATKLMKSLSEVLLNSEWFQKQELNNSLGVILSFAFMSCARILCDAKDIDARTLPSTIYLKHILEFKKRSDKILSSFADELDELCEDDDEDE